MKTKKKTGPKDDYKCTKEVVLKLEHAFSIDATIEEACYYADISRDTYHRWVKKNPKLSDKFERLRQKPILLARQTVVKDLDSPDGARWFLERKKKHEFSTKVETDVTSLGEKITGINYIVPDNKK